MPITKKSMIGETPGFNPQEEEWFKKGEESGESGANVSAEDEPKEVAETELEKKWFDKAA